MLPAAYVQANAVQPKRGCRKEQAMFYAAIRKYSIIPKCIEEVMQRITADFLPLISQAADYLQYLCSAKWKQRGDQHQHLLLPERSTGVEPTCLRAHGIRNEQQANDQRSEEDALLACRQDEERKG
jgi:hypothetical protein